VFAFIMLVASAVSTGLAAWYFGSMVRKEAAAGHLEAVVTRVADRLGRTEGAGLKERLATAYAPLLHQVSSGVVSRPGYWKTIYKTHHYLASAALYQGRPADAIEYLRAALRVHPYYLNGYEMLGNVWRVLGRQAESRACGEVAARIMAVQKPGPEVLRSCLGTGGEG